MIQGKEFIDCESDLIQFVKQDIKQGGVKDLLNYAGLSADELLSGLDDTEMYDYAYLNIDSDLYSAKIFLDKSIRDAVLHELKIVEVFTILIQRNEDSHRVVFTAIGKCRRPQSPYICYAYGFIDCTKNLLPRYYFQCLTEIK